MIVKVFSHYKNEGIESMINSFNSILGRDFDEIYLTPLDDSMTRVVLIWRHRPHKRGKVSNV